MMCTLTYDSSKANGEVASALQGDLERVKQVGADLQDGLRAAEASRQAAASAVKDPMFGLGGKRDPHRRKIDEAEQACLDTTDEGGAARDACLADATGKKHYELPSRSKPFNPEDSPVVQTAPMYADTSPANGFDEPQAAEDPRGVLPGPHSPSGPAQNAPPETLPPPLNAPFQALLLQTDVRRYTSDAVHIHSMQPSNVGVGVPSTSVDGDKMTEQGIDTPSRLDLLLAGEPRFISPDSVQDLVTDSLSINDLTSMQQGRAASSAVVLLRTQVCANLPSRQLVYSIFRGISNADTTPGGSVRCELE